MDESEVLKFEQEVRPLRLSEAIRIGALMRPHSREGYFYEGKTCALGAAFEAVMGRPPEGAIHDSRFHEFSDMFPAAMASYHGYTIVRMNDHEGKTREEIADWLSAQGL